MRFLAPRVSGAFNFALWRRRPAGHSWPAHLRRTYRARQRQLSRLGRDPSIPATLLGFSIPFAVLIPFAGDRRLSTPRSHMPFRLFRRREFHRRGIRLYRRTMGSRPRLLGFGPANEPCRATRRPRYSFCAQGRSDSPADTALGFASFLGSSSPAFRSPLLELCRPWALAKRFNASTLLQKPVTLSCFAFPSACCEADG